MSATFELVATSTRGVEPVLQQELAELGIEAQLGRGAVRWTGDLESGYRACLHSRVASRVLLGLARFPCADADALLQGVSAIPWGDHLAPDGRLAVDFVGVSDTIRNSRFGAMRTKDGVVDHFVAQGGVRPSVDLKRPDVRINVHLRDGAASVALDLSGDALHYRGGRRSGDAPLKETLAAALLRLADWPAQARAGRPLLDPMCGSGTLLLEAAGMALAVPPGLNRQRWGFSGWRGHDEALWGRLVEEGRQQVRDALSRRVDLYGADVDGAVLSAAHSNAKRDGMTLKLARRRLRDLEPPPGQPGLVVTNPPYGERLSSPAAAELLHRDLGDVLRRRFLGWDAWVITLPKLVGCMGLRPSVRHEVHNGPLDCRFVHLPISSRAVERDRR